mgnify:CR=1 FL=1
MYSQITANKRRTWVLMFVFAALILLIGFAYDQVLGHGAGYGGFAFACVLTLGMTATSYFAGDRIALWTSGARPVEKRDAPQLYRIVENLAITAGMQTPKVYVISDSAINAFATGRDPKHASIAVTSGTMDQLTNEELEGVIAHELSHVQNYDTRIMTIVVVLVGVIALLSDWLLRARFFRGGRSDRREDGNLGAIMLVLGIVVAIIAPIVAQLIKLAVSRQREYLADASGALLTRYPEGLARALEKIAAANQPLLRANTATAHLYIANPVGTRGQRFANLFSTHPPIGDRIRILRRMGI